MNTLVRIAEQTQKLPEPLQQEVLDFIVRYFRRPVHRPVHFWPANSFVQLHPVHYNSSPAMVYSSFLYISHDSIDSYK